MKHPQPPVFVIALLVAALPLTALAAAAKAEKKRPAADPAAAFAELDTDHNGSVSQTEYVAVMKEKLGEDGAKKHFAELDQNHDDKLSKEELGLGGRERKNGKDKAGKKKKNAI